MICFDVSLNEEKVCTAGVGREGVLSLILSWAHHEKKDSESQAATKRTVTLNVGGISDEKHVDWVDGFEKLRVGDTVVVRIVESEHPDPPRRRKIRKDRPEEPEYGPPQEGPQCSFCGHFETEVRKLIAGPTVYICDGCVELSVDILERAGIEIGAKEQPPQGGTA